MRIAIYAQEKAEIDRQAMILTKIRRATEEKDKIIQEKDVALQEKDEVIQEKDEVIQEKDVALQEKDETIKKIKNSFEERNKDIARSLLDVLDIETIATKTGLSIDVVTNLKYEM